MISSFSFSSFSKSDVLILLAARDELVPTPSTLPFLSRAGPTTPSTITITIITAPTVGGVREAS